MFRLPLFCLMTALKHLPVLVHPASQSSFLTGALFSYPTFQVVDMGRDGPLRCSKCRAYVNPFMQFHSYGKAFTCNFCGAVTPVPPEYQENIAPDGRRRDADERPELCRGSVEFVAPPEFQVGWTLHSLITGKQGDFLQLPRAAVALEE